MLVLGSPKKISSSHLSVRIGNAYREALSGFYHIYHPDSISFYSRLHPWRGFWKWGRQAEGTLQYKVYLKVSTAYGNAWSKCVKVAQSCLTLCKPMDYTVHGILQARTLEWVTFPFSRGSSQPRGQTQVSHIAGRFFISWATRKVG